MRSRFVFFTALFAVSSLGAPLAAPAAPGGLAWDSVSRMVQNSDATALQQPGNFDTDYATAAAFKPGEAHGGGLLGKMKQVATMGQNLSKQMFTTGFADKHFVAGSKERVDNVAYQRATITDCAARTVTTLDLAKKTYKVVSMDQPSSSGGSSSGGSDSGGVGKDDGTKIAIVVKNTALGAKLVGGQSTNGFASDTTFTETKPSGESHSTDANTVGFYSNYATPSVTCHSHIRASNPMQGGADMDFSAMSSFTRYADILANAGVKSDRFSVKQSGPSVPFGKLSMYEAMLVKGDAARGLAFVTERGNVRAIDANDPIFSVPGDFTKEN